MHKQKRRTFTSEFKLQICNLVAQGANVREVACEHDLTTGQIYGWLKDADVNTPSNQLSFSFESPTPKPVENEISTVNLALHDQVKKLKRIIKSQNQYITANSRELRGNPC